MNKAKEISKDYADQHTCYANDPKLQYLYTRKAVEFGYHQAEKDIKEELSNLFQEFMLDCINDDTETHILHFVDVFNNKIKTIGNE